MEKALADLTDSQKKLLQELSNDYGQKHLVGETFVKASKSDRQAYGKQLEDLHEEYQNSNKNDKAVGLMAYIENARKLLKASSEGVNPLEGWEPSVPKQGATVEFDTDEYNRLEKLGLKQLGTVGFVLVAGGLGERLGYSNIKVGLPTELATGTCYLQYYIEYILAVQARYGENDIKLPLCIMTSIDTHSRTLQLLEKHNYFGMDAEQVTLVQQGQGVPALLDNDAKIALDEDACKIITKPHGHGDVHALLYQHQVAKKWVMQGIEWLVCFQDTNGLAFHTLPLMLGVSTDVEPCLVMNSLAVPRKAKQAIGGIAQLTHKETGKLRTINVEYNQLDPILRSTPGWENGDVNDDETGYSPFPGNINQLLFRLDAYSDILERTKGIMPEFVNPKYKDDTKTVFKKSTRLECLMQDFPTVLNEDESKRVGFTSITAFLCFSPVKNDTDDGVKLQEDGTAPGTAATGEADQLAAVRAMMRAAGCQVEDAPEEVYRGIKVVPGPTIVLKPSFVTAPAEYKVKFPSPEKVKISARSTLIVNGSGVTIEQLDLDGALVIECAPGKTLNVKQEDPIKNAGWVRVKDEESEDEIIKMRGYRLERKETERIEA
ncbi:hypothetical protein MPSEU_000451600 [Mayamaea pseudoterrestris]|nr:hypothetical protein MPSEU_000451600 [Mayamaea pseudoterrestris]